MPEGIADVGEQSMIIDLLPLLAAGDYEGALARIRVNYGIELALIEAGDVPGFLRTRTPTSGDLTLRPLPGAQGRTTPSMGLYTDRTLVPLGRGLGSVPGRPPGNMGGPPPDTISTPILYVIGHSYFSLQHYLPAETAFKLLLGALPNHLRAHESLAMLYLVTERYEDARVHFSKLAELGRNTAHVHAARGYLEQKTHRYYDAADAFQKALILEPDSRTAKRGLLHALTETHEHGKAKALVAELLADEPDDPHLWLYRAQVALLADEPAVALASLETALRLGDDSVANRRTAAALHIESGSIARAAELLRGPAARGLELALVDRALGRLANANDWERFRELVASVDRDELGAVDSSRLATHRASLALNDGNRRAASTALQEALALDPANADALMAQGQLYREERDYGRADFLLRRASAYRDVREAAAVARAGVAVDQASFDDALTILRNAVTLNPTSTDLRRNVDVLEDIVLLRTQR
jgi:tetratricopeptide (TPR) repeat protein